MNNKQIKNLADGAEDGDAVNVSQLINMTTTANTEINKIKTDVANNHALFLALHNYIIRNELKDHIIKDLYFSDSREIKTANTYLFNFPVHLDPSNRNNFTFYYVFKHNTGTNNVMTIAVHWGKDGNNSEFHFYIHVSKSQIKISINPLIKESHLSLINIPNKALGKQILFWIWVQVVSSAAVIRVVTQRFSPTNGYLNPNLICFRGLANHNIPHIFLRWSRQD